MEGRTGSMISQEWVESTRTYVLELLRMTKFPALTRHGESVGRCEYPEWLIMLISVLAVKCKEKTSLGIHRLSTRFWKELCGEEVQLQRQRHILFLTTTRKGQDKRPNRKRMIKVLQQQKNKRLYKQRRYAVEPMQGLVKAIFELERCWMRGHENNRGLFAAMGIVVQMHQYRAWPEGRATWAIKQEVLGR